jgi:hypothetical protein
MYKILLKISAPPSKGIEIKTRVNRGIFGFLLVFFVYLVALLALKAEIFRHPNKNPNSDYSSLEKTYIALQSLRLIFAGVAIYFYIKGVFLYMKLVANKTSK